MIFDIDTGDFNNVVYGFLKAINKPRLSAVLLAV